MTAAAKLDRAIGDLTVKVGCLVERDRKQRVLRIEHPRLPCPLIVPIRGCDLERLAPDIETYIATLAGNPGGARFRSAPGRRSSRKGAWLQEASEPDLFAPMATEGD
jgi:hypothetical protein